MTGDELVDALKAVAHPVRLRILQTLAGTERNVGEIDEAADIGQPTLSQQLAVLRNAGLVTTRKDAKLEDPSQAGSGVDASYKVHSKHDEKWNKMLEALLEYKKEHNSTMVPQCYDQDQRLGRWVPYQRVTYKRF